MKIFKEKKSLSLFIEISISILIILFLFLKIGINNIYFQLLNNSFIIILLIITVVALVYIIETLKYILLLRALDKKRKFSKILKYVLATLLFGIIIPGKMGQFAMAYFLKKEDISFGKGVAIVLIDKIISLTVLSIFGIIGFYTFFNIKNAFITFLSIALIIALIIISLWSERIKNFIKNKIFRKHAVHFKGLSKTFFLLLKKRPHYLLMDFILTVIKWCLPGIQMYYYLRHHDKIISFIKLIYVNAITSISAFIPITVSGLGVRESIGVYLLNKLNINSDLSMSYYVIYISLFYVIALILYLLMKLNKADDQKK